MSAVDGGPHEADLGGVMWAEHRQRRDRGCPGAVAHLHLLLSLRGIETAMEVHTLAPRFEKVRYSQTTPTHVTRFLCNEMVREVREAVVYTRTT